MIGIAQTLGNVILVIIGMFSVVVVAIIIERMSVFFQVSSFLNLLKNNSLQLKSVSFKYAGALEEIIRIQMSWKTLDALSDAERKKVERSSHLAVENLMIFLEKRLLILQTTATISPTMGILGTVMGMIAAFDGFMDGGYEKSVFITGILQALYSTAFGLTLCIFCVVFFNYFVKRIQLMENFFINQIEKVLHKEG